MTTSESASTVRITVVRDTSRCTGPQPTVDVMAPAQTVVLHAPLGGRRVVGPRLTPLPDHPTTVVSPVVSNRVFRIRVPDLTGLGVHQARGMAYAVGSAFAVAGPLGRGAFVRQQTPTAGTVFDAQNAPTISASTSR